MAFNSTQSWGGRDHAEPALPPDARRRLTGTANNVLYLTLGQVGMTTLAIVFSAVLARTLGASDFGLYFLVTSQATFAYSIIEWGQPVLIIREIAQAPQRVGELLGTGLMLRVVGATVLSIPLLLIASLLGYGASTVSILALYFVAMLPLSLAQGFGAVFRGFDRMDRDALVSVLNSAARLVLVVLALVCGGGLAAIGVCQLAAGVVSLVLAHQLYQGLRGKPLSSTRGMARHLWRGGAAIVFLTVIQAAQSFLDVSILSKLASPEAVGHFGVARNIMGTLLAPAVILATAAFPQLSRAAGTSRFGTELRKALRPMMLIGALGSAGTYLFAQTVVEVIYGRSHYGPAVTILQVFAPGMFLLSVDVLLGIAVLAANRVKALAVVKVTNVVVSTILDLLLIPWCEARFGSGGIGVVVAFALSELVMFAGMIAIMPRGTLRPETVVDAVKAIAAAALPILLLWSVPLPSLAGIPLTILLFFTVAFALRLVHRSDLALLADMARQQYRGASTQC